MLYVEEGWREVGGETLVASGPAAVSGGHGQFHIFVRDHDGHLRHTPLRPGTSEAHWDPLSILARSCRSDPAAVYSSGSRIEVFVQDDHDNLRRITYDPLRSLRPVDRGPIHAEGTMPMGPSVASNSQGYFDILIRGANDRSVWSLWVDDGGTGSGWMPWGGSSVASAPTLALDPAGFFDVFYHDDSGYLS